MPDKLLPAPELISGERFKVIPGSGFVSVDPDKDGYRIMGLPLGKTSHDLAVMKHEYCHVKFTPAEVKLTDTEQACEDYRVNYLGQMAGIDFGDGFNELLVQASIQMRGALGQAKELVLYLLAAQVPEKTAKVAAEAAKPFMSPLLSEILSGAIGLLNEDLEYFATTRKVAKWIDEQFEPDKKAPGGKRIRSEMPGDADGTAWDLSGRMIIEEPPLTRTIKDTGNGRRLTPKKSGAIMYRPSRYITDGAIFRGVKRCPGGTILIDCSGSMSLTGYDIEKLVKQRPAATIAIYAGDCDEGTLRVIVRNGKSVPPRLYMLKHCGNVVDYPALTWLSKQKGPLLWICDGAVTGRNDVTRWRIVEECMELQRTARIRRFTDTESLIRNRETLDRLC